MTSTLQQASVLADPYIPASLRRVNEYGVLQVFETATIQPARIDVLPVVPQTPVCGCPTPTTPFPHCVPHRTVPLELYYAIHHRQNLLHDVNGNGGTVPNLPVVDDLDGMSDYCRVWEELILAERKKLLLLYERYSQYEIPIQSNAPRLSLPSSSPSTATIRVTGIADANPPLMVGDTVLIRPSKLPPIVNGKPLVMFEIRSQILAIDRPSQILITWITSDQQQAIQAFFPRETTLLYNVRFVPNVHTLEGTLSALDWIRGQILNGHAKQLSTLIFPTEAPNVPDKWMPTRTPELIKLNTDQLSFVIKVISRTMHPSQDYIRSPLILTGPAGTGKTRTLLAAIQSILSTSNPRRPYRMLICTPSHTSANVICKRLGERLSPSVLFRLLDSSRPVSTIPTSILKFCRQSPSSGDFELPPPLELLRFQIIVSTTTDAQILYQCGLTNQQLRLRRQCFAGFVRQSCAQCDWDVQLDDLPYREPHFTHMFLDEGAQATEPETLIPLSVVVDCEPDIRKVEIALVGDPRQLSPAVYSDECAASGMQRSWMERLLQRPLACFGGGRHHMLGRDLIEMEDWIEHSLRSQEQLSIFLHLNYRCHPSLLMMPSSLFYFDKLQAAVEDGHETDWCEKVRWLESRSKPVKPSEAKLPVEFNSYKQYTWPLHFRGVNGHDTSVAITAGFPSSSWSNIEEAQTIVDMITVLIEKGVATQAIGVMAPFRGQVVQIRKLLRNINLNAVNVGTVEDFQAVECDVCLISLTRATTNFVPSDISRRVGLFGQPKRANVALTRAGKLLVVVGSPRVMTQDPVWRQFLCFCLRNGLYYGESDTDHSFLKLAEDISALKVCTRTDYLADRTDVDRTENSSDKLILVSSLERILRRVY